MSDVGREATVGVCRYKLNADASMGGSGGGWWLGGVASASSIGRALMVECICTIDEAMR